LNGEKAMKKAMTIRVLRAVNNRLTKIVTSACLRRDEYLAAVLEREIEELDTEISIKNTDRARAFIKKISTTSTKVLNGCRSALAFRQY
jgi:hypothetical protein